VRTTEEDLSQDIRYPSEIRTELLPIQMYRVVPALTYPVYSCIKKEEQLTCTAVGHAQKAWSDVNTGLLCVYVV
jgi:hypothetical protein